MMGPSIADVAQAAERLMEQRANEVFDRVMACVDGFIARCEAGRNGMQPSPSHVMAQAIKADLERRKLEILGTVSP